MRVAILLGVLHGSTECRTAWHRLFPKGYGALMKQISSICLGLLTILTNEALSAEGNGSVQLLEVGSHHGDEVNAEDGSLWMVLRRIGKATVLEKATISVQKVPDVIVDEEGAPPTGKKVSIAGIADEDVVFMLRGLEGIAAGPVKSLALEQEFLKIDEPLRIVWEEGVEYSFVFECEPPVEDPAKRDGFQCGSPDKKLSQRDCALVIKSGERRQTLDTFATMRCGEGEWGFDSDAFPQLLWVGDLDGDKKPDFFLNLAPNFNTELDALFLSSKAGPGEIIKKICEFETTGC